MGGLIRVAKRLASTPQGRRAMRQAVDYARSPKGKAQIDQARARLAASRGKRRPPGAGGPGA